jgi:hypothetical protein
MLPEGFNQVYDTDRRSWKGASIRDIGRPHGRDAFDCSPYQAYVNGWNRLNRY